MFGLSNLLATTGIASPEPLPNDPPIAGVAYDSRGPVEGRLFVAIRGFHTDGHAHIADAIAGGAVAVVAERPPRGIDPRIPVAIVSDSRAALSALAAAVTGHPSRDLTVVGVTGTDGKTTTSTLLWSAWRAAGVAAASMTTVDSRILDDVQINSSRQTTAEAPEVQQHLRALVERGCTHVAMETSSHALELHRVDDVEYRAAVFTRITEEHLDVHGTRDAYLAAKMRLLTSAASGPDGIGVLDATDAFAFPRLARIPVATRLTYSDSADVMADVRAEQVTSAADGAGFVARTPWGSAEVRLRLAGRFNIRNALAALTAACATGAGLEAAVHGLESLPAVTGRMERLDLGQPFRVVVDYAHTAEALGTVLRELRETTPGRLWAVFGSAGERDVGKRPAMGAVAATLADVSVITDEDPRLEDRWVILEQIAAGATAAGGRRSETVVVIPDRAEAIGFAIEHAAPGDTVVCAGKGHEGSLITGSHAMPWDERAIAEAAIRTWMNAHTPGTSS